MSWELGKEVVMSITDIYFSNICWEGKLGQEAVPGGKYETKGKFLSCLRWEILRCVWVPV